jgi:hypothetical protein
MKEFQEKETYKYTSELLDYITDEEPGDDLIWETLDEFEDSDIENEIHRNKILASTNDPSKIIEPVNNIVAESKILSNHSSNFCICGSECSCPCERLNGDKSSEMSCLLDDSVCIADASICSCTCKHQK